MRKGRAALWADLTEPRIRRTACGSHERLDGVGEETGEGDGEGGDLGMGNLGEGDLG